MVRALGAMSGTSLDGVDAAVIETDGLSVADSARRRTGPTRPGNARCCVLRSAFGRGQKSRPRAAW